jgi:pimeloyl-ACP methyl ester carboxylesterase
MWRHQIGPLAERFRVIVPDLRGHGWSGKPRSSYMKTELLDDVLALLDKLGLERVRLVGHDWGGWVGMLAGLRAPQRIERLAVMSIPHPWQRRRHPSLLLWGTYQLVVGGPLGRAAMRHGFARVILKAGSSGHPFSAEELRTYDDVQREPDTAAASQRVYRTFLRHELLPWGNGGFKGERLTVPTLWIVGDRDRLSRLSDDGYRDHADDMRLEFVPGANHFLPEEMPQLVTDRLLGFL